MSDDEHEPTPVDTPRARRGSVSLATAELFVAQLEIDMLVPSLSDAARAAIAERLVEYVRIRVRAVRDLETREHDALREENRRLREQLDVARRAAVRHEP